MHGPTLAFNSFPLTQEDAAAYFALGCWAAELGSGLHSCLHKGLTPNASLSECPAEATLSVKAFEICINYTTDHGLCQEPDLLMIVKKASAAGHISP